MVVSVVVALLLSVGLTVLRVDGSLMIASVGAMLAGYATEQLQGGQA